MIRNLIIEEKPTVVFGFKRIVHSEDVTSLTDFQAGILAGKLMVKFCEDEHVFSISTTKI